MKNNTYFDAHCHIFTLSYVLKEFKNMVCDMLFGKYPWHAPDAREVKGLTKRDQSNIKDYLIQFYEILLASSGSEKENLDFLQSEALKVMPDIKFHIVPLMMDIYYMFTDPVKEGEPVTQTEGRTLKAVDKIEFQKAWDEILDDLERHIESKKLILELPERKALDTSLDIIKAERSVESTLTFKAGLERTKGLFQTEGQTEGYCYHLKELEDLVDIRRGELYPFIAVDPRRPGIIDEIIGGKYIGNDGHFYGVKLYPRLGYHPQAKPLFTLYSYCNENKIPITFHCGKSGFPPGTEWKYAEFGKPEYFEDIVSDYPEININFAHLGSSAPEWAVKIVEFMERYGNVYSDLSCYTNIEDLNNAKVLWDENLILKSRLMFGSDFDVMYLTGKITMKEYFENFKSTFKSDLELMMHDNPMKFLGL